MRTFRGYNRVMLQRPPHPVPLDYSPETTAGRRHWLRSGVLSLTLAAAAGIALGATKWAFIWTDRTSDVRFLILLGTGFLNVIGFCVGADGFFQRGDREMAAAGAALSLVELVAVLAAIAALLR